MAKNLVNGSNIEVIESGNNISLDFTSGNSLEVAITQNTNDIEEIKDAEVYSTSEVKTSKVWIDGKSIYRKVIDFGALPDTTQKTVASGVDFSTAFLVKMYGVCKHSGSNVCFALPFSNPATLEYSIMLNIDNQNNVVVTTGTDRTEYTGYVIIEYTKPTI